MKPTKYSHNNTIKMINNLIRGESFAFSTASDGFAESLFEIGAEVTVVMDVLVDAGKINVIAGKGTSVVVGVSDGVNEGVKVCDGALCVTVGDLVGVPGGVVSVTSSMTVA